MRTIDGPLPPSWPGKVRGLGVALGAGLRVPPAWALRCGEASSDAPELRTALERALAEHEALIIRSAFAGEDQSDASAAGLGLSVGPVRDIEAAMDALRAVDASRGSPALSAYRGEETNASDAIIVQAYVPPQQLLVAAVLADELDYIEVHGHAAALAEGTSPTFAGPTERWPHPAQATVAQTLQTLRAKVELGPHGHDVELVVDDENAVHLVQLRPLVVDLVGDGQAFIAAARAAGQGEKLRGQLVLDAEHNPEVLSVAHGSLIDWIASHHRGAGGPRTILGWLYTESLVRDLRGDADAETLTPRAALARLTEQFIPQARQRLGALDRALSQADAARIAAAVDLGLAAFGEMLRRYVSVLIPARAAAGRSSAARVDAPLSTRGRTDFIDVLPAAWDIASPTLAELTTFSGSDAPSSPPRIDNDDEALGLLGEWDDHFFALGLAAPRRVYVRAATALGLGHDEVFALELEELRTALDNGAVSHEQRQGLAARLAQRQTWNALRPPHRIDDGRALPSLGRGWLRGAAIGRNFDGTIAQRKNLEELLARPPSEGAIVVLPALTAQAALALDELGVGAVVCEYGGAMSHAALMSRELQLSALIGCRGCTTVEDGARATLDTRTGALRLHRPAGRPTQGHGQNRN